MNVSYLFGKRLRELRNLRHISAGQLASYLKCSKSLIYNIEKGLTRPQPELIVNAARFFGVTTDYLLMEEVFENEEKLAELYKKLNTSGKTILLNIMKFLILHE